LTTRLSMSHRSIWLWVIMAFVLDLAGSQHVYVLANVAAAALAVLALACIAPRSAWNYVAPSKDAPYRPLALLPAAAFVASMLDIASFVPPDGEWTTERLTLLVVGLIVLIILIRFHVIWMAAGAFILGTIVRGIHMEYIPIAPEFGDMLPLVNGAINNLLSGRSPYMTYEMPWLVPLTYLPLTWLSYIPAYLLGVDLRWTNIGAQVVIIGALVWLSAQRSGLQAVIQSEPTLLLWAWLYLQPSIIHWDMGNTAPITWALLAVTLSLVLAKRTHSAAIALGCTVAGTPLVAVFAVFIALYWLRHQGVIRTARLLAISGIVAGLIVLPFLLWSPQDFITGTYRWFNHIEGWPQQKWIETDPPIWSVITGFSGEFWARETQGWLKPIQAVIVIAVAGAFWVRGARLTMLPSHAVAAYLGFMLFNPVLWPYLYNPALIVGLAGIAALSVERLMHESPAAPVAEVRMHQPTLGSKHI
jgi:hypothetical protein